MTTTVAEFSFRDSVRADYYESSWKQRLLLIATVAWLAYEWGFGNETVTPWLLVRVISDTQGLGSVAATAAVGFTFTVCQQLASGFTAAAGFSMFSRTGNVAWRKLQPKLGDTTTGEWSQMSWTTRGAFAFLIGTTAVAVVQISVTGRSGMRLHRRAIIESAVLCATIVGAIGAFVAGLAWAALSIAWLETPAAWVIRILGNPLFWIALLGVIAVAKRLGRRNADQAD